MTDMIKSVLIIETAHKLAFHSKTSRPFKAYGISHIPLSDCLFFSLVLFYEVDAQPIYVRSFYYY